MNDDNSVGWNRCDGDAAAAFLEGQSLCVYGNCVYVFGGLDTRDGLLTNTVRLGDPADLPGIVLMDVTGDLPPPIWHHAASIDHSDASMYVVGGCLDTPQTLPSSHVFRLGLDDLTWSRTQLPPDLLPSSAVSRAAITLAVAVVSRQMFIYFPDRPTLLHSLNMTTGLWSLLRHQPSTSLPGSLYLSAAFAHGLISFRIIMEELAFLPLSECARRSGFAHIPFGTNRFLELNREVLREIDFLPAEERFQVASTDCSLLQHPSTPVETVPALDQARLCALANVVLLYGRNGAGLFFTRFTLDAVPDLAPAMSNPRSDNTAQVPSAEAEAEASSQHPDRAGSSQPAPVPPSASILLQQIHQEVVSRLNRRAEELARELQQERTKGLELAVRMERVKADGSGGSSLAVQEKQRRIQELEEKVSGLETELLDLYQTQDPHALAGVRCCVEATTQSDQTLSDAESPGEDLVAALRAELATRESMILTLEEELARRSDAAAAAASLVAATKQSSSLSEELEMRVKMLEEENRRLRESAVLTAEPMTSAASEKSRESADLAPVNDSDSLHARVQELEASIEQLTRSRRLLEEEQSQKDEFLRQLETQIAALQKQLQDEAHRTAQETAEKDRLSGMMAAAMATAASEEAPESGTQAAADFLVQKQELEATLQRLTLAAQEKEQQASRDAAELLRWVAAVSGLDKELMTCRENASLETTQPADVSDIVQRLRHSFAELQSDNGSLRSGLQQLRGSTERELEELRAQLQRSEDARREVESLLVDRQERCLALEAAAARRAHDAEEMQQSLADGQLAWSRAEESYRNNVADLQKLVAVLEEQLKEREDSCVRLAEEQQAKEAEIATLSESVALRERELEELSSAVSVLNQDFQRSREALGNVNGQVESLTQELSSMHAAMEERSAEVALLSEEKSRQLVQIESLEGDLQSAHSRILSLESSVSELTAERDRLQSRLDDESAGFQTTRSDLERELTRLNGRIVELEHEMVPLLREKISLLSASVALKEEEVSRAVQECARCRSYTRIFIEKMVDRCVL